MKSKRVGIMGGTFDPIHLGHLAIAKAAHKQLNLDIVLFIPNGTPYMKSDRKILNADLRYRLVEETLRDYPCFLPSGIEICREGNSYTCETIQILKQNDPYSEYFLLVGADSLYSMESWKCPQMIFSEVSIAVAIRETHISQLLSHKIQFLEEKYGARIFLLSSPNIDISSTEIRRRIREGESIQHMVHPRTQKLILEKGLYL